jgi:hypothetical protein
MFSITFFTINVEKMLLDDICNVAIIDFTEKVDCGYEEK